MLHMFALAVEYHIFLPKLTPSRFRRSTQKPGEEFYAAFRKNFANLAPWPPPASQAPVPESSSLSEAPQDAGASTR